MNQKSLAKSIKFVSKDTISYTCYLRLNSRLKKQRRKEKQLNLRNNNKSSPGTATKNLTASRCPWKQSCACAIEQYGMNVPGVTLSLFSSPYTRITLPGRFPEPAAALLAVKEEKNCFLLERTNYRNGYLLRNLMVPSKS